jgi:integrase
VTKSVLHQILDRAGFSPVTKEKYRNVIDRWIDFAGTEPSSWTRDRAQDWYDQLLEGGISVPSANTYLASLRYVSRWYATKTGNTDFAIVQRQRGKKGRARQREGGPILTEEETRDLLMSCIDDGSEPISPVGLRDLALIVTGLETGMRRMSFLGLNIEAIHHTRGFPSVLVPIKGPGGEETFDVPLSDAAYAALSAWIAWLRSKRITSGPAFRRLSSRQQIGDEPLTNTGVNELIAKRAKLAEIRHINPHMLRHTFISWRSQAGLLPIDIAEITGHKVSTYVVDNMAMRMSGMSTYMHRDVNTIRNTTPVWLAALVAELLR